MGPATRKKLTTPILKRIITGFYTHSAAERDTLLGYIPDDAMETDEPTTNVRLRGVKSANAPLLPEVDCYLHLLVLLFLMDGGHKEAAVKCSNALVDKLASHNRRSLDHVAGRCYFYHTLSHGPLVSWPTLEDFCTPDSNMLLCIMILKA